VQDKKKLLLSLLVYGTVCPGRHSQLSYTAYQTETENYYVSETSDCTMRPSY